MGDLGKEILSVLIRYDACTVSDRSRFCHGDEVRKRHVARSQLRPSLHFPLIVGTGISM